MSNLNSNTHTATSIKKALFTLFACFSLAALPGVAVAKKVYSPFVEEGELEIVYYLDYAFDGDPAKDNAAKHQFELEYGVTDRWKSALYGVFTRNPGQSFRYSGLKWENTYQLFDKGARWLDAGLYLEYSIPEGSSNGPDALEFKLLLEKSVEKITHTANLILEKELGANATSGTAVGYAWRSKMTWLEHASPAIELYGSLGEVGDTTTLSQQSHQLGPVFYGELPGELKYEIGYLFGLTSGSYDGMLKLILEYEF